MPDILKKQNGDIDYTKIFMAFGAMLVLVLQQWQSYRIAEIQATAKANEKSFMPRKEVNEHIRRVESSYVPKEEVMSIFKDVDERLKNIERHQINKGK